MKLKQSLLSQFLILGAILFWCGWGAISPVGAATVGDLSQGEVIQISPVAGTYMCGAQTCTSNGAAAEPYKLMATNVKDTNATYFLMMDNYCAWRSANCYYAYNGSYAYYWYGTSFNSTGSNTTYSADLGGSRQSYNILSQLNNFYNTLPTTIGGMTKANAIPTRTFSSPGIVNQATSTYRSGCYYNTNVTAFGNIGTTFTNGTGDACAWTSKVALPSYEEWQGGLGGSDQYPATGSIGYSYCLARYGSTACNFNDSGTLKGFYRPWTRTPYSANNLFLMYNGQMSTAGAYQASGVLPSLYLSNFITTATCNTAGTYASPHLLEGEQCGDMIINPAVWDEVTQTLTITGTGRYPSVNHTYDVYADVCNVAGNCIRQTVSLNTGANPSTGQPFTLTWTAAELPTGEYSGTIWVTNTSSYTPSSLQTNPVYFQIDHGDSPAPPENSVMNLSQGEVIQISPTAGTYMCGNSACSANGVASEPYKLMYTGTQDGNAAYFVMLDNYCAWRSSTCYTYSNTLSWTGSTWNGYSNTSHTTGTTAGYHTDLGASRKTRNILIPLNSFYSSLPSTIGGVAKATAVPLRNFDMTPVEYPALGSGTSTYNACAVTDNATAYGGIQTTFNNCNMSSRVSLLSYNEWQGTSGNSPWSFGRYPQAGAIGSAFCQARFGTPDCRDSVNSYGLGQGTLFNQTADPKRPYRPWLRTVQNDMYTWYVAATSGQSVNRLQAYDANSVLPSLWLSADVTTSCGQGTYQTPYALTGSDCPPLIIEPTAWDEDTQSLTITGEFYYSVANTTMAIWADVCNANNDCIRKAVNVNSGNPATQQTFTLVWQENELPSGNYAGTIAVNMEGIPKPVVTHTIPVSFSIDQPNPPDTPEQSVVNLTQGEVIQIQPQTDTYMCANAGCSANSSVTAEPYKLMYTGIQDYNSAYFVMLDNYCAWRSAGCTDYSGNGSWLGTTWNGTGTSNNTGTGTGHNNDLGASRKARNILVNLNNFYNTLPDTIAGVDKATAVPSKSFNMTPVTYLAGVGTSTYGACNTSTNNLSFGNIETIFDKGNCTMTSRVALPSYDEWQGKSNYLPWAYGRFPQPESIGYSFCVARFGADNCFGQQNALGITPGYLFQQNTTLKMPYYPWLRTPRVDNGTAHTYYVNSGSVANSVLTAQTYQTYGVLPSLWLSSTVTTSCGEGTYDSPYALSDGDCGYLKMGTLVWDDIYENLTLTGEAIYTRANHDYTVWADVCNQNQACVRKSVQLNSGDPGSPQEFTLYWDADELAEGVYDGTIWVYADSSYSPNQVQTDYISFDVVKARTSEVPPTSVSNISQGKVIQIQPQGYTYMCNASTCTADAAPSEPYKLMYTGMRDADSAYYVMLDNYCAWRSADCGIATGATKYWYGTAWNDTATTNLGNSAGTISFLANLENFYNSLPTSISNLSKEAAIPLKSYDMRTVNSVTGRGTATYGSCMLSANTLPFGNMQATFNSCNMNSRVALLSYDEWQGKVGDLPRAYQNLPPVGTIGSTFCQTRYGTTDCADTFNEVGLGNAALFAQTGVAKMPYRPWLRTPAASNTAWWIYGNGVTSVNPGNVATAYYGILPSLWLSSDVCLDLSRAGTYDSPYDLASCAPYFLTIDSTVWDGATGTLTLSGYAKTEHTYQDMIVWTDVCNTTGECVRKQVTLNSGHTAETQSFTFVWSSTELPPGEYLGTIWTHLESNDFTDSAESAYVDFEIVAPEQIQLQLTQTEWQDEIGLAIAGNARLATDSAQTINLWADVCNTDGDCLRKQTVVDSGIENSWQDFSLAWSVFELPPGNYSGTIWVQAATQYLYNAIQSTPVSFEVGVDTSFDVNIAETVWNNTNDALDLTGTIRFATDSAQTLNLWADVCNTNGDCLRKQTAVSSGTENTPQAFTLSWPRNELPYGIYSGTVWVNATSDHQFANAQSLPISFEIDSHPNNPIIIKVDSTTWNEETGLLSLSGTSNLATTSAQTINLWADVCNSHGDCQRKQTTVNSGTNNDPQSFTLTWSAENLTPGTYAGTIWVHGATNLLYNATQSQPINFYLAQPPQNTLELIVTETFWNEGAQTLTLEGAAQYATDSAQTINLWADVCNTDNQCFRKDATLNSGTAGMAQDFTLVWQGDDLAAGTYAGTVWVHAATNSLYQNTQSVAVNFEIAAPPVVSPVALELNDPTWDGEGTALSLSGTAQFATDSAQTINLWADVCNEFDQCFRQQTSVDSGVNGDPQSFSLTWLKENLLPGTYAGTIWVSAATSGGIYNAAQTSAINFTIPQPDVPTIHLTLADPNWDESTTTLTLAGTAQFATDSAQVINLWADVCNTDDQCFRKQTTVNSGTSGTPQNFNLAWSTELLPGTYSGTIWVQATAADVFANLQSSAVNFTVGTDPVPQINLQVTSTTWDSVNSTLTLGGTAKLETDTNQLINLWADVCNSLGQCMRKQVNVNSGTQNLPQSFTMTWTANELAAGGYAGTIWVQATAGNLHAAAQSSSINFSIGARTLDLTVVTGQPFNLKLGDAAFFNLPAGTSNGVTVSIDSATNTLYVSGNLTQNTQASFGNAILNFQVMPALATGVQNVELR